METPNIIIIGTGPEARIALDIFTQAGTLVLGFINDNEDKPLREINDVGVFASLEDEDARKILKNEKYQYFLAIGDIRQRKEIYERVAKIAKRPPASCSHPMASQSQYAQLGFGNLFSAHTAIHANVKAGDMNFFHTGVSIEPDAEIGSYCTLSSGVRVGGNVRTGDAVFVGTGAILHPGVKIGSGAVIGAGSVVLREVKAGKTVHGNPAVEI